MKIKIIFLLLILSATTIIYGCTKNGNVKNPKESKGLACRLENAAYDDKTRTILVDFILKNKSQAPIRLYERWNSCGASQWSLTVIDKVKRQYKFTNPQDVWTKNYPSVLEIRPDSEFILHCKLILEQSRNVSCSSEGEMSLFTQTPYVRISKKPIRLYGTFASNQMGTKINESLPAPTSLRSPNWSGVITTDIIDLK